MRFIGISYLWLTRFGTADVSLGIHICWKGRIDFHFLWWMVSLGIVPIYEGRDGKRFAVSNSYHSTKRGPLRAGNP